MGGSLGAYEKWHEGNFGVPLYPFRRRRRALSIAIRSRALLFPPSKTTGGETAWIPQPAPFAQLPRRPASPAMRQWGGMRHSRRGLAPFYAIPVTVLTLKGFRLVEREISEVTSVKP